MGAQWSAEYKFTAPKTWGITLPAQTVLLLWGERLDTPQELGAGHTFDLRED